MAGEPLEHGNRRETRLLVLVVVVSLAVLLLLARFRFPGSDIAVVAPTPGPLAGLAARAAFDDMSASVRTLLARTTPHLLPIVVERQPETPASRGREAAPADGDATKQPMAERRLVPALRVRSDMALVPVPSGFEPVSGPGIAERVVVAASDPVRGIALLQVDPVPGWTSPPADTAAGLQYAGAFGATAGGITVQPTFLGRVDVQPDERWPVPVLLLGNITELPAGLFLFSVDGRLLGMTVRHAAGTALVPPGALEMAVASLLAARAGS